MEPLASRIHGLLGLKKVHKQIHRTSFTLMAAGSTTEQAILALAAVAGWSESDTGVFHPLSE
jgi:hypothetical protein